MAALCLSSPCSALSSKFSSLSIRNEISTSSSSSSASRLQISCSFRSLSFSSSTSPNFFSTGSLAISTTAKRPIRLAVVCEAAPQKKADSAAKRARQNEKRRIYHKSRKSEVRTRMRKVLKELDALYKKKEAQPEEVLPIEKLIGEAYSVIDKAVKVGTLHRNTGARRKSRLARRKRAVQIRHGWYTPEAAPASA